MAIQTVQAERILHKSRIPGAEYVINPYTGCVHGCAYCYARFMKRFTGHTEPWGSFLDAKVNAPEVLKRQLATRKGKIEGEIFLSSVTDPYQPPESRFRLTRGCLEVLLPYQPEISILTKSDLVLRDIDLLSRFKHCRVGLSMMTVDDAAARAIEPRASKPSRRIEALRELRAAGVYTYAFISPFIPMLSDFDAILEALTAGEHAAVDEIGVEAINTAGGNWKGLEEVLAERYPDLLPESRRLAHDDAFWEALAGHSRRRVEAMGIASMGFFRHGRDSKI
jgi:DNA repair photolyase